MPKQIWNEGRVVGYSAYEIYVKQHLLEDPNSPPASEREWLASSLAMGSSMLVKIPKITQTSEDSHTYHDIVFPTSDKGFKTNSRLAAANTIVASFFEGEAEWDEDGTWATKITDYGPLISNTSSSSPSGTLGPDQHEAVPRQPLTEWSDTQKNKLKDYMKIVDGLIIQPGTWETSEGKPPEKTFTPTWDDGYPTFRIHVKGSITNSPYVLLTGFTIRGVLAGTTGTLDDEGKSLSPQDGDFLGPGTFPWANKVIFSVPSSYIAYFASGAYKRKIGRDSAPVLVQDTPVIDMKTVPGDSGNAPVLENYYSAANLTTDAMKTSVTRFYEGSTTSNIASKLRSSRVTDAVSGMATFGDGEAVLTVYQKKAIYPPALYGTFVDSTGTKYLHPLDNVAPGSMKMFYNASAAEMKDYQNTFPGTTSFNKTPDGELEMLDSNGNKIKVGADLSIVDVPNFNPSIKDTDAQPYMSTYVGTRGLGGKTANGSIANIDVSVIDKTRVPLNLTGRVSRSAYTPKDDTEGLRELDMFYPQLDYEWDPNTMTEESTYNPAKYPQSSVWNNPLDLDYGMLTWERLLIALKGQRPIRFDGVLKYYLHNYLQAGPGLGMNMSTNGKLTLSNTALFSQYATKHNPDTVRFVFGPTWSKIAEDDKQAIEDNLWDSMHGWTYEFFAYNGFISIDQNNGAGSGLYSAVKSENEIRNRYASHQTNDWIVGEGDFGPSFKYKPVLGLLRVNESKAKQNTKVGIKNSAGQTTRRRHGIGGENYWTLNSSDQATSVNEDDTYDIYNTSYDLPVTVEIEISTAINSRYGEVSRLAHREFKPNRTENSDGTRNFSGVRIAHTYTNVDGSATVSPINDVPVGKENDDEYRVGNLGRLFGIKFTGDLGYLNATEDIYENGVLKSTRWLYNFRDTTSESGIWNVYSRQGSDDSRSPVTSSWNYRVTLRSNPDYGINKPRLIALVTQVEDGQNSQIGSNNVNATSSGDFIHYDEQTLFSPWINLTLNGVFYARNL